MDFIERVDKTALSTMQLVAESDQFAIYSEGNDAYLLVQRHESVAWTAIRFSGDGIFRVGSLVVDAMRHLYRDVASNLSPNAR
ncbi:MAG: hypothetical protein M3R35_02705 [Candidatus Eremiobacteraeota bacterium]|nr:hypothetical protein [Candidatus Eremiobacteraeota bacterium]